MVFYSLIIILVGLWLVVMIKEKDILCPDSIICLSYIVATLSAVYNYSVWEYDIHSKTVMIISTGILAFIVTSCFISLFKRKKSKIEIPELNEIIVNKNIMFLLNLASIVIFLLYGYFFIKGIGGFSGLANIEIAMRKYRYQLLHTDVDYIPTIINLLSKYCRALAFVSGYILINNAIYYKKNKIRIRSVLQFLLPILIFIPFPLMTGSRFDLISYLIFMVMVWYIITKKNNMLRINIMNFIKFFLILVLILLVFSETRTIIGRDNNSDTISYATSYFGGSIIDFDMYLQDDKSNDEYIGQELFSSLRKFLVQIHLIDEVSKNESLGMFRYSPNGTIIGNVYTAFRKMYNDFGIFGVIFFQIIMSCVFNYYYYYCLIKRNNKYIDTSIIIYSCLYFCLAFHSYSEFFYSTVISFNYVALFLFIILIVKFMSKVKIGE